MFNDSQEYKNDCHEIIKHILLQNFGMLFTGILFS